MGTEVFVAAVAVGAYSQWQADSAAAKANKANAAAYRKQAEMAALSTKRQLEIFDTESPAFLGDQISSFARAGVDLSGSALMAAASSATQADQERRAIKAGATMQADLFMTAERQANAEARRLTSFENRALGMGSSLLNAYAGYQMNKAAFTEDTPKVNTKAGSSGQTLTSNGTYHGGGTKYKYSSNV